MGLASHAFTCRAFSTRKNQHQENVGWALRDQQLLEESSKIAGLTTGTQAKDGHLWGGHDRRGIRVSGLPPAPTTELPRTARSGAATSVATIVTAAVRKPCLRRGLPAKPRLRGGSPKKLAYAAGYQ